jgi:membrane fusion protein, heavy metal efflux system
VTAALRRARWWIVAALALAATGGGVMAMRRTPTPTAGAAPAVGATPAKASLDLPPAARDANPIATAPVARVKLAADLHVVGSVSHDQDRHALVGPLVPGRVARLRARVGDTVAVGDVLAEIESADVGHAQAAYLAARARARAAQAHADRERDLAAQKISSERDRELAEAQAVSEHAELQAATERLRAFGLGAAELRALDQGQSSGGRVALRAPIAGVVVKRAITLGQAVERATDAFELVDLSRLWILLSLYEKDLPRVRAGQEAEVRADGYPGRVFRGRVAWVNPLVDARTRTADARIELSNPGGALRPGQFVTARIVGDAASAEREVLAVPRRAVQTVEGKTIVFVRGAAGFERRAVDAGATAGEQVEIRAGVHEGDVVVTDGAFFLKSELLR